ncbi:hypothetical protein [Labrenzia sp. VG12]|uniref:hypothetical protein n=1 Tax=Labrenzia sp. VG12 TaxID=2021862 RepID=UPI000B8BF8A8|nr:hypothetical protein [Labrenzia sp. VG12]ASP32697.1 hypothetical protein CHH27_05100 [Labrenzia sp. VG12]
MKHILVLMTAFLFTVGTASALDFRLGIVGEDESRYDYEIGLIRLALKKADGEHELEVIADPHSSQARVLLMLMDGVARFNVTFSGIDRTRHDRLLTIPIPLQRGLLGQRILIVSQQSRSLFDEVSTLEDLKALSIGSGHGWPDTDILQSAGFNVAQADYEDLFKMVDKGRIAGYARGVAEPYVEVAARTSSLPNLLVEKRLLISYPFDTFFFVAKQDKERHDILLQGLERAYEDGSFLQYFRSHPRIRKVFDTAKIEDRIEFAIENPLLPDEIANIDAAYWHRK